MRISGHIAAIVIATAAVSGQPSCAVAQRTSAPQQAALPSEVPSNYRRLIVEEMKTALTTQTQIRDAQISQPEVTWGGVIKPLGKIATICVKYTATSVLGGATNGARLFYFADGKLATSGGVYDRLSFARWCQPQVFSRFREFDGVK
jgi:hypothetical protein